MEPLVEWDSNRTQSFVEGGKIITIQTGATLHGGLQKICLRDSKNDQ